MVRSAAQTLIALSIVFATQSALAKKPRPAPTASPTPAPTASPTPTPTPAPVPTAQITVNQSNPTSASATAGTSFNLTYNFSGGPSSVSETVFVHFVDANGAIAFLGDFVPSTSSTTWSGALSFAQSVYVPSTVPAGTYQILVGLYDQSTGNRLQLLTGSGVVDAGSYRYQVGTVTVQAVTSPTPTPSPTPTASTPTIPSGYTAIPASNFGIKCDGVTDDAAAIQNAANNITSYQALVFPAGTCVTSNWVTFQGKSNIAIIGAGKDLTILKATDPLHSTFDIYGSSNVLVSDLQVWSPNTTYRTGDGLSRGFYADHSSYITWTRLKVNNVAGAAFLFFVVTDSTIQDSDDINSWADAFHATGGSQRIVFQRNTATGAGDDCFASIGYGTDLNYDIQFLNNSCYNNQASGVSFEGTIRGKAYGNYLDHTGVAGVRIDSQNSWSTGAVSQVDVENNTLVNVRTRQDVGHAAVMIYTDLQTVDQITFSNNVIRDPLTSTAVRAFGLNGILVRDSLIQNNQIQDSTGAVTKCISLETGTLNITSSGNTKNGVSCNN